MRQITLPDGLTVFGLNPDETRFMHSEVFAERCYLQNGIALRDGDCVFDVGANVGMAMLFFHGERKDIRIFAFEPNPAAAACLRANAELHGVRATVFECGLMASVGMENFTLYPGNTVVSGFRADAEQDRATTRMYMINSGVSPHGANRFVEALFKRETHCSLPVRTLSEIVDERQVVRIDLLKINVEHSEREVLGGLRDEHWDRIQQVAMEVTDQDGGLRAVLELLRGRGFQVEAEQEPRLRGTAIHSVFAKRNPG